MVAIGIGPARVRIAIIHAIRCNVPDNSVPSSYDLFERRTLRTFLPARFSGLQVAVLVVVTGVRLEKNKSCLAAAILSALKLVRMRPLLRRRAVTCISRARMDHLLTVLPQMPAIGRRGRADKCVIRSGAHSTSVFATLP